VSREKGWIGHRITWNKSSKAELAMESHGKRKFMEMENREKSGVYRFSNPSTLGRNRPGPSDAEVHLL
jgi:hypothetical protein